VAAELRWILLVLSVPMLAGIWWWTARRSRQSAGNAELRESTAAKAAEPMPSIDPRHADVAEDEAAPEETVDWGVSPLEPLSVLTADFDQVPVLDAPMMIEVDHPTFSGTATLPAASAVNAAPATSMSAAMSAAPAPVRAVPVMTAAVKPPPPLRSVSTTGPYGEDADSFAANSAPAPNAAETQRIVTVRVCSVGESRWPGTRLKAALETHGLAFGRYHVFHRKHADGRSLFCVASMVEPGTFNLADMAQQEFRGVTLFAVLPGPTPPLETMDELLATARGLAEQLSGMVQDGKGMPMSPQRAAALREDIARFQSSLARS
jgi:cell division protein ZipA